MWPVLSRSSVCGQGQWSCRDEPCSGKCQVYGNGHYQTFDSNLYRFDGHCQYTFVEVKTNDNIYFFFVLLFLIDASALPTTQHRLNPSSYSCLNLLEVVLVFFPSVMWIFVHLRMPVGEEMAHSPSGWRVSPAATKHSPVLALLSLTFRWTSLSSHIHLYIYI